MYRNTVHVSGQIRKHEKTLERILHFWDGRLESLSDKGIVFIFGNSSDASGFRREVLKLMKSGFDLFVE